MRYNFSARGPNGRCTLTLLTAALAACSTGDPTSPGARTDRSIPGTAEASVAQAGVGAAAALSNRFAYVWADQPTAPSYTPNSNYAYNATSGSIQIVRQSVGFYQVLFNSATGWGGGTHGFAATAYGSSTLRCSLRGNAIAGTQLVVDVICQNLVSNVRADSRFTLLVVGNGSLSPRSAFAFANQPSAPSYTPNPLASYSTGPGSPLITHNALAGDYTVKFGTGTPAHSIFLVGAQAGFRNLCKVGAWQSFSIRVRCFDAAGAPHDTHYWAMQVEGGRPGRRLGFAFTHHPTLPSYTPNLRFAFNSSGGAITATRSGVGQYAIEFTGLQKLAGHTEQVQITPWGPGPSVCNVMSWGNSATGLWVSVECRKLNGNLTDARYNVLVIE